MNDKDISDWVKVEREDILSDDHFILRKAHLRYRRGDGSWQSITRQNFALGRAAAVLPLDPARSRVLLVRQFRWPVFAAGHHQMLVEAIAGRLDGEDAQDAIRREALEEAGITLGALHLVSDCFVSPGAVGERVACFLADYDSAAARAAGGGLAEEGEDIEALEMTLDEGLALIASGQIIDAKTILLLQAAKLKTYSPPG